MCLIKFALVCSVLCLNCSDVIAKRKLTKFCANLKFRFYPNIFLAFFNVAIQKSATDEGHQISFVYPKKSNEIKINFSSKEINKHSFDIFGFLKKFTNKFTSKFNLFMLSKPATESPDTEDEVTDEVTDSENESWSSTEDYDSSSSSSTEGYESVSNGYDYSSPEDSNVKIYKSEGYEISADAFEQALIPPPPSRSSLSTFLLKEEIPVKLYLPTNLSF